MLVQKLANGSWENCSLAIPVVLHVYSLADPGKARGCLTNTFVIHWLSHWLSHPLVKIYLRRRHNQMVKNGASSHKTNYIEIFSEILNLEGHLNRCVGSAVTAILLNGWILHTGGVTSDRVCPAACAANLFIKYSCMTLCAVSFSKGRDIWDFVDIVILRYDHWPQYFSKMSIIFGKWPVFSNILIIIFSYKCV